MIRLTNTNGKALHQGNDNVQQDNAYTEGCIGVTGNQTSSANENMNTVVENRIVNSNGAILENVKVTLIVR